MPMTPKERVFRALRGEWVDRIPFTDYKGDIPQGQTERLLRNDGLALVHRCQVFSVECPNVVVETKNYLEDGQWRVRNTYRTPVGEVWQTWRTGGGYGTSLRYEFLIKQPEDYKVLQFMMRDEIYTPEYEDFLEAVDFMGDDGVVIGNLGYSPIQEMLVQLMGPERFAIDLYERPDAFFSLYETIAQRHREQFEIAANSPAEVVIYGDNITSEMIGLQRFENYCLSRYNELASYLHPQGKLLGVHMDGKMRCLAEAVARSQVDIIEAFNPAPCGDFELAEARRVWKDKVIWINYPSSVHLYPPQRIEEHTHKILEDVAPGNRFLIGITENVPANVWQISMSIISKVLKEEGNLPLRGAEK